jgi:hypothetical protein
MRSQRRTECTVLALFLVACWYVGHSQLNTIHSGRHAYLARGQNSTDTAPKVYLGPPTHLQWFQEYLAQTGERLWKQPETLPWRPKTKSVRIYYQTATSAAGSSEAVQATSAPDVGEERVGKEAALGNLTKAAGTGSRAPRPTLNATLEGNGTAQAQAQTLLSR